MLKGQNRHTEGTQWKGIPSESVTLVMVITQCKLQVLLITWAYTISFNKAQADGSAGNSEAEKWVCVTPVPGSAVYAGMTLGRTGLSTPEGVSNTQGGSRLHQHIWGIYRLLWYNFTTNWTQASVRRHKKHQDTLLWVFCPRPSQISLADLYKFT